MKKLLLIFLFPLVCFADAPNYTPLINQGTNGSGSGATIPSTSNLIKGDGAGNGADSGINPSTVIIAGSTSSFSTVTTTNLTGTNTFVGTLQIQNQATGYLNGNVLALADTNTLIGVGLMLSPAITHTFTNNGSSSFIDTVSSSLYITNNGTYWVCFTTALGYSTNFSKTILGFYGGPFNSITNVSYANLPSISSSITNTVNPFNNGIADTNLFLTGQSTPSWQSRSEQLPWRGSLVSNKTDLTNQIAYQKTLKLGFNILGTFQQAYNTYRVGGIPIWNTTNFPDGQVATLQILHTNGFRFLLWYDPANAMPSDAAASATQFVTDIKTIASWNPDILWIDVQGYYAALAAQILATNPIPIQVMYGIADTAGSTLDTRSISLGNAWRLHVSADVNTWPLFLQAAQQVESNAWFESGPGQFFYLGPELNSIGTATETASGIALQCMYGNVLLMGFVNNSVASAGPFAALTRPENLAIQSDPADVCARLVSNTNGCWIYLKPLGTAYGPNYAIMVLNTNASTTSMNFNINSLAGLSSSGAQLTSPYYSIFDLKNSAQIGDGQTNIVVTSLASHDYALYKLTAPTSPITSTVTSTNVQATYYIGTTKLTLFTARANDITTIFLGGAGNTSLTGVGNFGAGYLSGSSLTTGAQDTFVGSQSGVNNTIGTTDTTIGFASLNAAVNGIDDTAIGASALKVFTGTEATAVGAAAGLSLVSGNFNTFIGTISGTSLASGQQNVFLGYNSGANYTGSESFNIDIGVNQSGPAGESGVTRIGNSQTTAAYITGPIISAGFAVTSTNRLVFTSVSSLTNTMGRDANAIISAGTSVTIQDTNGVTIATLGTIATLDSVVGLHINMRIGGTGVSAILY